MVHMTEGFTPRTIGGILTAQNVASGWAQTMAFRLLMCSLENIFQKILMHLQMQREV